VIVSTEDEEIARISREFGAEVPFLRPDEYAQDDTPDWPVFFHALDWLRKNEGYCPDLVINLRATTPNRDVAEIDKAIKYFLSLPSDIDGLRSVRPSEYSPYKMCLMREDGCLESVISLPDFKEAWGMPRQFLPQAYQGDGYIDIIRPYVILDLKSMRGPKTKGYIVDAPVIDIDVEEDFQKAQQLLEKGKAD
jgi:N-acylneuraminate cytidylyltransferase